MADLPRIAYTFDFVRVYLSVRDTAPPGSGTWSPPVKIFDGSVGPPKTLPYGFLNFSAGGLKEADPYDIVINYNRTGGIAYLGNGLPTAPIVLSPPGGDSQFDSWDESWGGFRHGSNVYFVVVDAPTNTIVVKDLATYTIQDPAHGPASVAGSFAQLGAIQRINDKIYVFTTVGASFTDFALWSFDLISATWSGPTNPVTILDLQGFCQASGAYPNSFYIFQNGNMGVFYEANDGTVHYLPNIGGVWQAAVVCPGVWHANSVIDVSSGFIHAWSYTVAGAAAAKDHAIDYFQVSSAGVPTATLDVIPATVSGSDGAGHPSIQIAMIFLPRDDAADFTNAVWVSTNGANNFLKELLPVPVGESGTITLAVIANGNGGSGYVVGDTGTVNGGFYPAQYTVDSVITGGILAFTSAALGTGYAIGDTGTINGGTTPANYVVTSVGVGGTVTGLTVDLGAGYSVAANVPTTTGGSQPGIGTGLKINITSVTPAGYVTGLSFTDSGGGYSNGTGVGTTDGGSQPGVGTGLLLDITVGGKVPSCAYMMYPNGYRFPVAAVAWLPQLVGRVNAQP